MLDAAAIERVFGDVMLEPNGCWRWTKALTNGYGVVWLNGRLQNAHRVAYRESE